MPLGYQKKTDYATPLKGHLVSLKTVQETRAVDNLADAYVAEISIKSSNQAIKLLDAQFPEDASVSLSHLRRFARPEQLPEPLRAQVTGESGCMYLLIPPPLPNIARLREVLGQFAFIPASSSIESQATTVLKTGKRKRPIKDAGDVETIERKTETATVSERVEEAATVQPDVKLLRTRISLNPPTSLLQAQAWSKTLWPTQFNAAAQPANHSPPPPMISQIKSSVESNAGQYLALAEELGREAKTSGRGRGVGMVITDPDIKPSQENPWAAVVAAAGDARYWDVDDTVVDENGPDGHPERHAMMRAIAVVSNKRLASSEQTSTATPEQQSDLSDNSPAAGVPLSSLELQFTKYALPPSYLCTNLDAFITHEPCIMCSMALLLSRFRSITFIKPTSRADAALDPYEGYGLHWRRELNWRAIAFQFVADTVEKEIENKQFNA